MLSENVYMSKVTCKVNLKLNFALKFFARHPVWYIAAYTMVWHSRG